MGNSHSTEKKEKEKKAMKGLITICSECRTNTELRTITIEFERKGIKAAMSGIPAMVCPCCGQEYVPGDIAGDVIDTVSRTIDATATLLKQTDQHRRELFSDRQEVAPERLELALASR
jgi:YgiT-type zinc finger domain-containing protein